MKKYIAVLISLFFVVISSAQDVVYARHIVNELSKEKFHGRGYVKNGDVKAAKFIAIQFKQHGLKNFNGNYFQRYSFPINTFPGRLIVAIDNCKLIPGKDYVISSSASSVDTEYEIHNLSHLASNQDSLIMAMNDIGGQGMYFINEKNTKTNYGKTIPCIESVTILTEKTPNWHVSNGGNVVNLDMVGSGSDGITVVNGSLYDTLMQKMYAINDENQFLKEIKSRGESCNSDHCPFFQKGVKSIFIYTRGKELTEYHTNYDTPDDFPFTAYNGCLGCWQVCPGIIERICKKPVTTNFE
ncbi:MAG: M28 family peptidase [Bacteroidetes bacterium]|nr:M28 family peptidase [Bacteroidota bacterium]MBL6944106.1 M28 family peptidase [Bacteroidales bacterium]